MLDEKQLADLTAEKASLESAINALNAKNNVITDLINNADKYNEETLAKINADLEVKETEITEKIVDGKIEVKPIAIINEEPLEIIN